MNILDKISDILRIQNTKLGYMPDDPSTMLGLFEYTARPPDHTFGNTDIHQCVQARCRAVDASDAYQLAETVSHMLNRYCDAEITALQYTPILDIGRDGSGRQEYTINFEIRRY